MPCPRGCNLGPRRTIFLLMCTVQVALACAIGGIVGSKLKGKDNWLYGEYGFQYYGVDTTCLMNSYGYDTCSYAFAVMAVSLLCSLVMAGIQFFRGRGHCVAVVDIILSIFAFLWWCAFALVCTILGIDANLLQLEGRADREVLIGLAWAQTLVFLATAIAACIHSCAACCGCGSKKQPTQLIIANTAGAASPQVGGWALGPQPVQQGPHGACTPMVAAPGNQFMVYAGQPYPALYAQPMPHQPPQAGAPAASPGAQAPLGPSFSQQLYLYQQPGLTAPGASFTYPPMAQPGGASFTYRPSPTASALQPTPAQPVPYPGYAAAIPYPQPAPSQQYGPAPSNAQPSPTAAPIVQPQGLPAYPSATTYTQPFPMQPQPAYPGAEALATTVPRDAGAN